MVHPTWATPPAVFRVADSMRPGIEPRMLRRANEDRSLGAWLGDAGLDADALASVHAGNFPGLLQALKGSLLATTFQKNMLIVVRSDAAALHTHFVALERPMGLAADVKRLHVGTSRSVCEFRNLPAIAARVDPSAGHDAVYLKRNEHVTGSIDVHEIAFAGDECWYVNTLFSCLCTLDAAYSFVPRWRPPFITGYAPEDRCHLNGVAIVDGRPRYVTALGASNAPQGWRDNKRDGGVLIDVDTGQTIVRGLSMPHSPRWYRDRLWLLESGRGSLATVDLATGRVDTVIQLPGFTRGLDFCGPLAFVGLSQLRASNPFTDIPLTDQNPDRASGIWVVNIESGQTVAFLRFAAAVEEIFAVQLLRGVMFPHIVERDAGILGSTWALPPAAMANVEFAPEQSAL